jgi:hypothetical protein
MLVSSWGLEDGATRGRQRKWVRGGFLADGGFLALFCWRGMVVVGWWVRLGLDGGWCSGEMDGAVKIACDLFGISALSGRCLLSKGEEWW